MDLDTCPDVTRVTDALQLRGRTLTLDLAGVYFMDSMCLNMLLRLRQRADIEDGTLELCGLQDQPRRLLDLTGAAGLFSIFERCSPEPVHVTRV
ncbi:STAS domain-containing protein [Streptomyces wuyuanensis]|uniref:STAS domain-containing protein n=1 Tax=Streptomyces wuyuanensis TaxID=1196353 RepID=UPI0037157EF5